MSEITRTDRGQWDPGHDLLLSLTAVNFFSGSLCKNAGDWLLSTGFFFSCIRTEKTVSV